MPISKVIIELILLLICLIGTTLLAIRSLFSANIWIISLHVVAMGFVGILVGDRLGILVELLRKKKKKSKG